MKSSFSFSSRAFTALRLVLSTLAVPVLFSLLDPHVRDASLDLEEILLIAMLAGAIAASSWSVLIVTSAMLITLLFARAEYRDDQVYSAFIQVIYYSGLLFCTAIAAAVGSLGSYGFIAMLGGLRTSRWARLAWSLTLMVVAILAFLLVLNNGGNSPTIASDTGEDANWEANFEGFDAFPLLWLGSRFAGCSLQATEPEYEASDGIPQLYGLAFSYGDCPYNPVPTCITAVRLQVRSACRPTPEAALLGGFKGPPEKVRGSGVMLRSAESDGQPQAIVWTGQSLVIISTPGLSNGTKEVVQALHGLGINRFSSTEALSEPEFSQC